MITISYLYHTLPNFNTHEKTPFENIMEKEENAYNKHFLFSPIYFTYSKIEIVIELHIFCPQPRLSIWFSTKLW